MAYLKITDLFKSYANTRILEGINVEIEKGEFLVLLGPSGCGKTTLLNCIAGLTEHSGGDIFINGANMNNLKPSQRDIAMVFQSYALYPTMNVEKNMRFGLEMRKIPKEIIAKKIAEVAETLQIRKLLSRKPGQLSGGQRQRVAMGRAIVRDPKVFLFDEPLSNLDAKLRVDMRTEIHKLHRRLNATIVYVTHDQIEAMTLADKIALLSEGRILQIGSPKDMYFRPVDKFTASFIGSPSINFAEGEVIEIGDGLGVRLGYGEQASEIPVPEPSPKLIAYKGKKVLLGIRPEKIKLSDSKEELKRQNLMPCPIEFEYSEMAGSDTFVFFKLSGHGMLCCTESGYSDFFDNDRRFFAGIDMTLPIFFDPQSEKNIEV